MEPGYHLVLQLFMRVVKRKELTSVVGAPTGIYYCDIATVAVHDNETTQPVIRASVDALCRDGTSEISRDPRTKRLQTRRESLAMPSKHTNNNF